MPKSIWQAIRQAAGPQPKPDTRTMLQQLYGSGPRGGLNTKRAADRLGVSERTVRRWAKTGAPNSTGGQRLRSSHQRWARTAAGRVANLNASKIQDGANVAFLGTVTISKDTRERGLHFALNRDDITTLLEAARGGNTDLHAALEQVASSKGFGGEVHLEIKDLQIR